MISLIMFIIFHYVYFYPYINVCFPNLSQSVSLMCFTSYVETTVTYNVLGVDANITYNHVAFHFAYLLDTS